MPENPYQSPQEVNRSPKARPRVDWRKVRIAFVTISSIAGVVNLVLMTRLEHDLSKGDSTHVAMAIFNAPALPIMCLILPCFPVPMGEQFMMTHEYFFLRHHGGVRVASLESDRRWNRSADLSARASG